MMELLKKELDNDIDRVSFYSNYRKTFENRLVQSQVNGYEAIFDAFDTWEDYCLKDPAPFNQQRCFKPKECTGEGVCYCDDFGYCQDVFP